MSLRPISVLFFYLCLGLPDDVYRSFVLTKTLYAPFPFSLITRCIGFLALKHLASTSVGIFLSHLDIRHILIPFSLSTNVKAQLFIYVPLRNTGGGEVWLHSFLTSELDFGEWPASRLGHFTHGKHYIVFLS